MNRWTLSYRNKEWSQDYQQLENQVHSHYIKKFILFAIIMLFLDTIRILFQFKGNKLMEAVVIRSVAMGLVLMGFFFTIFAIKALQFYQFLATVGFQTYLLYQFEGDNEAFDKVDSITLGFGLCTLVQLFNFGSNYFLKQFQNVCSVIIIGSIFTIKFDKNEFQYQQVVFLLFVLTFLICQQHKNEKTKRLYYLDMKKNEQRFLNLKLVVQNLPLRFAVVKHDFVKEKSVLSFINAPATQFYEMDKNNFEERLFDIKIFAKSRIDYKENVFDQIKHQFNEQKQNIYRILNPGLQQNNINNFNNNNNIFKSKIAFKIPDNDKKKINGVSNKNSSKTGKKKRKSQEEREMQEELLQHVMNENSDFQLQKFQATCMKASHGKSQKMTVGIKFYQAEKDCMFSILLFEEKEKKISTIFKNNTTFNSMNSSLQQKHKTIIQTNQAMAELVHVKNFVDKSFSTIILQIHNQTFDTQKLLGFSSKWRVIYIQQMSVFQYNYYFLKQHAHNYPPIQSHQHQQQQQPLLQHHKLSEFGQQQQLQQQNYYQQHMSQSPQAGLYQHHFLDQQDTNNNNNSASLTNRNLNTIYNGSNLNFKQQPNQEMQLPFYKDEESTASSLGGNQAQHFKALKVEGQLKFFEMVFQDRLKDNKQKLKFVVDIPLEDDSQIKQSEEEQKQQQQQQQQEELKITTYNSHFQILMFTLFENFVKHGRKTMIVKVIQKKEKLPVISMEEEDEQEEDEQDEEEQEKAAEEEEQQQQEEQNLNTKQNKNFKPLEVTDEELENQIVSQHTNDIEKNLRSAKNLNSNTNGHKSHSNVNKNNQKYQEQEECFTQERGGKSIRKHRKTSSPKKKKRNFIQNKVLKFTFQNSIRSEVIEKNKQYVDPQHEQMMFGLEIIKLLVADLGPKEELQITETETKFCIEFEIYQNLPQALSNNKKQNMGRFVRNKNSEQTLILNGFNSTNIDMISKISPSHKIDNMMMIMGNFSNFSKFQQLQQYQQQLNNVQGSRFGSIMQIEEPKDKKQLLQSQIEENKKQIDEMIMAEDVQHIRSLHYLNNSCSHLQSSHFKPDMDEDKQITKEIIQNISLAHSTRNFETTYFH